LLWLKHCETFRSSGRGPTLCRTPVPVLVSRAAIYRAIRAPAPPGCLRPRALLPLLWRWVQHLSASLAMNGPRSPRSVDGRRVLLTKKSGSPEDTDLERISLGGPRIKHLRDLFVIESGAQSGSRTLSVLTTCEYRGCLTQQRVWLSSPWAFWRAPAVTPAARRRSPGDSGPRRSHRPQLRLRYLAALLQTQLGKGSRRPYSPRCII
jgi:hypothetical protein